MSAMVQICGNDQDYNNWATVVDDSSWNYANMLQYIKKHQNMSDSALMSSSCGNFHGNSGPIGLSNNTAEDWFTPTLKKAFTERNYPSLTDINCGGPYTGKKNFL